MGLKHAIETDVGVAATYFHIQRMDVYPRDGVADITVNGFVSYEARIDGKSPIWNWASRIDVDQEVTQSGVYSFLKTIEPFIGATDQ